MTDISCAYDRVLAVHPANRWFGWALFDGPDGLLDWGIVHEVEPGEDRLVKELGDILSEHKPSVLVFEEYEGETSKRSERIQNLYRRFKQTAKERQVPVAVYSRELVASVLEQPAHASRYEIAKAVAGRIEDLSHKLPPRRRYGDGEDARQSLFAAAALGITRYAVLGQD